ncbi:MAG: cation transporter [Bacilli bacterium]|nr:cation transporter [Bacilli bacterium]
MEFIYKLFIKDSKTVTESNREKFGIVCGGVGVFANVLLVVLKLIIGIITSSISIIGDAINNMSDSLSSIINVFSFKINAKPADKEHPYGHRKSEYIGGLLVSVLILFVSFELFSSCISRIITPVETTINLALLIVLIINIIIKLFMTILYRNTYKKINSISLKAAYKDSLNDILTTFIIVGGLYTGSLFKVNVDAYLGILLSIYIFISGINLVRESIGKLMTDTLSGDLVEEIIDKIRANEHVITTHDVLTHKYGEGKAFMSIHVEMDASYSLLKAHNIVDKIERKIKDEYDIDILIHIDPVDLSDDELASVKTIVEEALKDIDESFSAHDIRLEKSENRLYFDLEMPYKYHTRSKEFLDLVKNEINRKVDYKLSIDINYK